MAQVHVQVSETTCIANLKLKDMPSEPPCKKQKILQPDEADKKIYFGVSDISESVSGVESQLATSDQDKVVELLTKLYPTWERVLLATEDPSQVMDAMVLLSYIDCGWPKLFLTQDDMFRMKPKISRGATAHHPSEGPTLEHPAPDGPTSEGTTSLHHIPDTKITKKTIDDQSPERFTSDGIATQLQVDSARLQLGENLGDVALILNAFYGWCVKDKREKLIMCQKYLINESEMKVLGKAFQDLLDLIERETNVDMNWTNTVMNYDASTAEKMNRWTSELVRKCPELLYMHSGVPGQEYMNFTTGNVEPHYLNRNFNFDMNVEPSKYVLSFPCDVSLWKFPENKHDNLLTIKCDPTMVQELCHSLYPDDLEAREKERAIKAAVITDIGTAVIKMLMEQQRKITDMENDISVQCGIPHVLVHVQIDRLRNQLHVFVPETAAVKAQEVAQYHVDVIKATIESKTAKLCPYTVQYR